MSAVETPVPAPSHPPADSAHAGDVRALEAALGAATGETPGTTLGAYRLLEKLGEGGFGVVWMAEQQEPIRRRVALKIIKVGMDTEEVITRFEAERQALALMEHPNIARVFDAGATAAGRPYFVMELVRGTAITRYCDDHRLPTVERLRLFTAVCSAVQHAHQKGVIHRDLKPSNILVTRHDGVPVPKVIDFGIAKATSGRLADQTLFTRFHTFLGTPAYTSPEQIELSGLDVDTRSDIYSLGVLLYELLTGRPPFAADTLARAGLEEMRRLIREVDPPRPSTRLDTLSAGDRTSLAQQRGTDPRRLSLLLRGDLDWIVMRALEKDRTRRYDTADSLGADVQRYLADEPVLARPPGGAYRLRKFVRRHRLPFFAGSAAAVALVAALLMMFVLLGRERSARAREGLLRAEADAQAEQARVAGRKSAQVAQFMKDMLGGVAPSVARGRDTTMLREILDATAQRLETELADEPEVAADLRHTLGAVYRDLGQYAVAEKLLREAVSTRRQREGEESPELAASLEVLAKVLNYQGRPGARELMLEALAIRRKHFGDKHPLVVQSLAQLSHLPQSAAGSFEDWAALRRQVLELRLELLGAEHPDIAESLFGLGSVALFRNDLAEAARLYREALELRRRVLGPDHPELVANLASLAAALREDGNGREAEPLLREALTLGLKVMPEHPRLTAILLQLAGGQPPAGADEALVELARATVAAQRARLGPGSPSVASSLLALSILLAHRPAGAEESRALADEAAALLTAARARGEAPDREIIIALGDCASGRIFGGAPEQALGLAEQRLLLARAGMGPSLAELPSPLMLSALARFFTGRPAEAVPFWEEVTAVRPKPTAAFAPILGHLSLLGAAYRETGRLAEAQRTLEDGLAAMRESLGVAGRPDPAIAAVYCELGLTLNAQARFAEAEQVLRLSLEQHDRAAREKATLHRNRLWQRLRPRAEAESGLGAALAGQGRFDEAEPLLRDAIARLAAQRDTLAGDRDKLHREAVARLVDCYHAWGRPEQAAAWRTAPP